MKQSKFPTPWRVHTGKLRPQFATRIVEILDRDGNVVLPWNGFDAMSLTYPKQRELATRIVQAVNAQESTHD